MHMKKFMRNMMKKDVTAAACAFIPPAMAFRAAFTGTVWMVPAAFFLVFVIVALFPACRRHESLWIFVLTCICALPANWLLLNRFSAWHEYLDWGQNAFLSFLITCQYVLICTGLEEAVFGLIGRLFWRKQYRLYLPDLPEDD